MSFLLGISLAGSMNLGMVRQRLRLGLRGHPAGPRHPGMGVTGRLFPCRFWLRPGRGGRFEMGLKIGGIYGKV